MILKVRYQTMTANVPALGEVADFGNEICQPCTNFELKTKMIINRETRHFAKRVLAEGLFSQNLKK
jgi:hypothetical protein